MDTRRLADPEEINPARPRVHLRSACRFRFRQGLARQTPLARASPFEIAGTGPDSPGYPGQYQWGDMGVFERKERTDEYNQQNCQRRNGLFWFCIQKRRVVCVVP